MKTANEFNCTLFHKHVSDYIDEELDDSLRIGFLEHAASCRACARLVAGMRDVKRTLSTLSRVEVSEDFNISLRGRLALETKRMSNPFYRARLWFSEHRASLVSIPAAAAVLIAALLFGSQPIDRNGFQNTADGNLQNATELATSDEDTGLELTRYILDSVDMGDLESGVFLEDGAENDGGAMFQLTSASF